MNNEDLTLFIAMGIAFVGLGLVIVFYLKFSDNLLDVLKEEFPDTWKKLGKPKRVSGRRGRQYLTPVFPFLVWLVSGSPGNLFGEALTLYKKTRILFFCGMVGFTAVILLFLFFVPSGN